jgi:stress-induced morphogen
MAAFQSSLSQRSIAMAARKKKSDPYVRQILETLQREYQPAHPKARIDTYRYSRASIRIRVIDGEFAGKNLTARDDAIWEILTKNLPEDVLSEINLLLLLAPQETAKSLMNLEFENPTPLRR